MVTGLRRDIPSIERVSPKLTGRTEIVGGNPGDIVVNAFTCHEERVVVEPIAISQAKSTESCSLAMAAIGEKCGSCFVKQRLLEAIHAIVLDLVLREARCGR